MATAEHPRRDAAPARRIPRATSPSLRIRTAGGFVHEVGTVDVPSATAFAEWLSAEALGALRIELITRPGREPAYVWVRPGGGERAPWDTPPASGDPVVLGRCTDRSSYRALEPPQSPGVVIADERVVVDAAGREYAMRPCAVSTDGMMDGEIRVDGRASVVRFDGGSYLVNHSP